MNGLTQIKQQPLQGIDIVFNNLRWTQYGIKEVKQQYKIAA